MLPESQNTLSKVSHGKELSLSPGFKKEEMEINSPSHVEKEENKHFYNCYQR